MSKRSSRTALLMLGIAGALTMTGCSLDGGSGGYAHTRDTHFPHGRWGQTDVSANVAADSGTTDGGLATGVGNVLEGTGKVITGVGQGTGKVIGGIGEGVADAFGHTSADANTGTTTSAVGGGQFYGDTATASADLRNVASMAFPTGDARSSAVMLTQRMPHEVTLGEPFDYVYEVKNLTSATLQNVIVSLDSTSNLNVVASDPRGSAGGGGAFWNMGDLAPGATETIKVRATASQIGQSSNCVSVAYNNTLCAATNVVQPALALTKQVITPLPNNTSSVCDTIQYVFEVRNTGTGTANNVRLHDDLPDGIVTSDGRSELDVAVGTLAAGEGKRVTINAKSNRTGTFNNTATASADGGLTARSGNVSATFVQPQLSMSADCTGRQFIGRNFTHTYTVRNTGNGVCDNTTLTISPPQGAAFVRSSAGGSGTSFNLGRLEPGAEQTVSVTFAGSSAGTFRSSATVNCPCSEPASDSCETLITGIPAILLEVIDINDPVEVGSQETYVISVTNQGSAPDSNIIIQVQLPGEEEYISSSGATAASVSGKTVTFAPYPSLAPKQRIEWRVVVRAAASGDVRFGVQMDSDQLTSPVRETEATNLYQ